MIFNTNGLLSAGKNALGKYFIFCLACTDGIVSLFWKPATNHYQLTTNNHHLKTPK
jgi:hypothetical protein